MITSGRVHDGRERPQEKLSRVTKYEVAPDRSSRKTMMRATSRREKELSSASARCDGVGFGDCETFLLSLLSSEES